MKTSLFDPSVTIARMTRMRWWMALLLLTPACTGPGISPPDGQTCFGSFVQVCFLSPAAVPTAPGAGDVDRPSD